jgi:hypothetical protein
MLRKMEHLRIPHDNPPNNLLMLTAYFDESGHESPERVVVAGYFGDDDDWSRFSEAWREGLGKRKALHMSALRWNGKLAHRTKSLLERLGPIPREYGLVPLFGSVCVSDYADLIGGTMLMEKLFKGFQLAAMPPVMAALGLAAATGPEETVKIVFEEQREYDGFANIIASVYEIGGLYLTKSGKPRLAGAGIDFLSKGATSLTQPGDYLAFALRNRALNPSSRKAKWSQPILAQGEPIGKHIDRETIRARMANYHTQQLQQLAKQLEAPLREHMERYRAMRKERYDRKREAKKS